MDLLIQLELGYFIYNTFLYCYFRQVLNTRKNFILKLKNNSNLGNFIFLFLHLKGSDRLCKVVELSMLCFGKLLSDSFETY